MKEKDNVHNESPKRRDFLANISMAAAALTLNSAFGFPVETEQGNGRLFLKIDSIEGNSEIKNGVYQFSQRDLEKLKSGKMETLTIKLEVSLNQRNWDSIETGIADKNFIKQITEIVRKA
jgi:hypothetical protein